MKKRIYILILLLFVTMGIDKAKAGISGYGQGTTGGSSYACGGGFCANSMYGNGYAYGIRMSVVSDTPNGTNTYLSVDYWATSNMANYISSLGTLTYGKNKSKYKYKGKVASNSLIQGIVQKMGKNNDQILYKETLSDKSKFLKKEVLESYIKDINEIYDEEYELNDFKDFDDGSNYKHYYFLIEPIFLINVYNVNYHHYYQGGISTEYRDPDNSSEIHVAGTAKEIIKVLLGTGNGFMYAMLDSCTYSNSENYVSFKAGQDTYFPDKSGWSFVGPWNVVNNFLINPYYNGPNTSFIEKVGFQNNNKCYLSNGKKNYMDVKDNLRSGLSKYIVKYQDFGIPNDEPTPQKTCEEKLNDILSSQISNTQKVKKLKDLYNKEYKKFDMLINYGDENNPDFTNVKCEKKPVENTCKSRVENLKNRFNNGELSNAQALNEISNLYNTYKKNNLLSFDLSYDSKGKEKLDINDINCGTTTCEQNSLNSDSDQFSCITSTVGYNNNKGCYYGKGEYEFEGLSGVYCTVGYEINLNLVPDTVFVAGTLLWPDSSYRKSIKYLYSCSSFTTNKYQENDFSSALFSDKKINISIDGEKVTKINDGDPIVEKHELCYNGICYYQWDGEVNYKLELPTFSAESLSGLLEKVKIDDDLPNGYIEPISGIPSDIAANICSSSEGSGENSDEFEVPVEIKIGNNKSTTLSCKYKLEQKFFEENNSCKPIYNFEVRIIDTNNPFPGKDGNNNRVVGSNWCTGSYLGKMVPANFIRINKDEMILFGDEDHSETVDIFDNSIFEKEYSDFDGDGVTTSEDISLLTKYISGEDYSFSCKASNDSYLVKNVIKNNKNSSNSTKTPKYTFILNASDIKKIKDYNKNHDYTDIQFDNNSCGKNGCLSSFVTNALTGQSLDGNAGNSLSLSSATKNSNCYYNRILSSERKKC